MKICNKKSNQKGSVFSDFVFFGSLVGFGIFALIYPMSRNIAKSGCYEEDKSLTCVEYVIHIKKTVPKDYKRFHDYVSEAYSDRVITHFEYAHIKSIYNTYDKNKEQYKRDKKAQHLEKLLDEELNK